MWALFGQAWLRLLAELSALYVAISFLVELLLARLPPERIRSLLHGRRTASAMAIAVGLGAVTPFCSCSTVPLVAGMMRAGIPFPPLAAFLVMSPLVNPAIVALLATWAGPAYAALFVTASALLALAVGGFFAATRLSPRLPALPLAADRREAVAGGTLANAGAAAWRAWVRLLPAFVLATGVGAILLAMVPPEAVTGALAGDQWWRVPLAALVGIPVYASTAVLLPVGTVLYASGAGTGVVTAFILGATGFSIPEAILLRRLVGGRLLAAFGGVFTAGVVALGYLFQALG